MAKTLTKEQIDNYKLLFNTVEMLSNRQGYYRRLLRQLINMTEEKRLELINSLPTFKDAVGVIMWLEQ